MRTHSLFLTAGAVLLAVAAAAADRPGDYAMLLDGVTNVVAPGSPGAVLAFGPDAFPLVCGQVGGAAVPVAAAARTPRGRVVLFGHTGYTEAKTLALADTARLLANAVRWAGAGRAQDPRDLIVGAFDAGTAKVLEAQGLRARAIRWSEIEEADVVVGAMADCTLDQIRALSTLLREGGGVVASATPWAWTGGDRARDWLANRFFGLFGLAWIDGYPERTGKLGFAATGPPEPLVHPLAVLDALAAGSLPPPSKTNAARRQAEATLVAAVRCVPLDDRLFFGRLESALRTASVTLPTVSRPVARSNLFARAAAALACRRNLESPPESMRADPTAAQFPGAVPDDAPRVDTVLTIAGSIPRWHGTGLYAPPGGPVTLGIPADFAGRGLRVRIGCHSDELWELDSWARPPAIASRHAVTSAVTRVASAFGGLIYIEVPEGGAGGDFQVRIAGAVEAPRYVLGKTPMADWMARIRGRPAPWAELESSRVVVAVPSAYVRLLDDPEGLMMTWDRILDACADLAAIPRERAAPERIVPDVQISAGYMHSGYPIMTGDDQYGILANRGALEQGQWGLFHEIGHNHQSPHWTFEGTGEVTENLFSLYVMETVCKRGVDDTHEEVRPAARARNMQRYFARGAPFALWQRDPFLGLCTYIQIRQAFGWEPFKKVFAEYRAAPPAALPKTEEAKRDQFMVRMSKAVGRNLGPFFQRWGIPTTDAARAQIAALPAWMPPDLPAPGAVVAEPPPPPKKVPAAVRPPVVPAAAGATSTVHKVRTVPPAPAVPAATSIVRKVRSAAGAAAAVTTNAVRKAKVAPAP